MKKTIPLPQFVTLAAGRDLNSIRIRRRLGSQPGNCWPFPSAWQGGIPLSINLRGHPFGTGRQSRNGGIITKLREWPNAGFPAFR